MKLYEINEEIMRLTDQLEIDTETGEIIENTEGVLDQLNALEMDRQAILQKLLKDCMTKCGFWKDDAQVVREMVEKRWADEPMGIYIEIMELEAKGDGNESL